MIISGYPWLIMTTHEWHDHACRRAYKSRLFTVHQPCTSTAFMHCRARIKQIIQLIYFWSLYNLLRSSLQGLRCHLKQWPRTGWNISCWRAEWHPNWQKGSILRWLHPSCLPCCPGRLCLHHETIVAAANGTQIKFDWQTKEIIILLTRHWSSIAIAAPWVALFPTNQMVPLASSRVWRSVTAPPVLFMKLLVPCRNIGYRKPRTAPRLVALLFVKLLFERNRDHVATNR